MAYARARDAIADVNANLQESLSGVRVAQAYVPGGPQHQRLPRRSTSEYLDHRLGAQRLIALYFPFVLLLSDLGAAVGARRRRRCSSERGIVTAGVVIAFLLYLDQFFSPIQQLSQVLDTWQQATASIAKIEELLDTPTGTPAGRRPGRPPARCGARCTSTDVHFRYPNTEGAEALAGVDAHDRAGRDGRARRRDRGRASRRSSS